MQERDWFADEDDSSLARRQRDGHGPDYLLLCHRVALDFGIGAARRALDRYDNPHTGATPVTLRAIAGGVRD